MASADIRLVRWTPARMRARLGEVIAVYKAAFLDVHEADPVRAARDRMTHARRHTERRDLRAVAALTSDDTLVGVTYAMPGRQGQWWHDVVATALSPAASVHWLEDCLEIVELHVLPEYQGQGIGRELLRELLRDVPYRTAALSALELPDSRARRLYASEGFVPLLSNFRFPGSYTPYAVLGKELPPPSPRHRRGAMAARFGRPARAL
ncbi:GNAT family N-acetyltransferase [Pseudofrankia inefficax]|uniref:GCN5-related N-acetyltransferase n=1 Tax=Pseudofrankia inefficax (strain DSM 45817 / CECT 9037 / DDB 130130 / EuI1c) TaxID=298654 RepID=E3J0A9_PSEI1|nr:GNAT family N-acetyltransferase [Pseudofrankia inefficax]ADP80392.1 GCN5-related N-acetyltransferase [Pseudofrankia inefficax]